MAYATNNPLLSEENLLFIDSLFDKHRAEFSNSVMRHGFFTGLICAPTLIMPSRYLPIVWGQNNEPTFGNMEEVMHFHSTCNKLWNLIADNLHNKVSGSFPIPVGNTHTLLDWLTGFQYATGCAPDDWQLLANDKKACHLLALIIAMQQKYTEDKDIELDKDDVRWLAKSISYIYDFFYALRMEYTSKPSNVDISMDLSTHRKTGRNEPCPCGSGKKYKKCCIDITFH